MLNLINFVNHSSQVLMTKPSNITKHQGNILGWIFDQGMSS